MQHIGSKIKELVQNSKFSVKEIAEKIGISSPNIYRLYERESVETRYLVSLSEICGVPVGYFFGNADENILNQEIGQLKEQLAARDERIAQLIEKNEMLGKLLESAETKLQKRVESDNFLARLFETAQEQKISDDSFNTSAFLFKFAQSLLEEGDVSAFQLVNKMMHDPEVTRLIDMTLKKKPRSL